MLYAYTQEQMQTILNYLVKRPYEEVYPLIDIVQQAKIVDDGAPTLDQKSTDVNNDDDTGITD